MGNLFATIASDLDLNESLRGGSATNDMLPERPDDKVSGEVGNRFTESLKRKIEQGNYEPEKASFVYVPKSGNTTRPAAVLNLSDRVVYEALAAIFRPRLEQALIGSDIVLWPRSLPSQKRWLDFERAPLSEGAEYIVRADISGFYESIDHERLTRTLIEVTGRKQAAEALEYFLNLVMGQLRGVPQGIETSDVFATACLVKVDAAMISSGAAYWRHGDDIRIATKNYSDARESLFELEKQLREQGFLLNGGKSTILRRETYETGCHDRNALWESIKQEIAQQRAIELTEDNDALESALNDAGFDGNQVLWDLHYHNRISVDEVVQQLTQHLKPSDYDVAETVFNDAMQHAPESEFPIDKEIFHQRISSALLRLSAGKRPVALGQMLSMLATYPDKTEILCSYLHALAASHPTDVCQVCSEFLMMDRFSTGWQKIYVLRVLNECADQMDEGVTEKLCSFACDETEDWIVRVESARLLAIVGALSESLARRLLNISPAVFKADMVFAISKAKLLPNGSWADRLLQAQSLDPVMRVVILKFTSTN